MSFWSKLFGKKRGAAEMNPEQFAAAFSERIRNRYPGVAPRLEMGSDPASSRITWVHPGGLEMSRFLGNIHQAYRQQPDQFEQIVNGQLAAIEDIVAAANRTPEQRRANILPVIKTRAWVDATSRQLRSIRTDSDVDTPLIIQPLAGDLIVTYIEDKPDSMSFLTPGDLDGLSIRDDGLHPLALANLSARLPQLQIVGGGGRFAVRLDQNYNASMVLLFEHWRERINVVGDPVIAIPARDELLLCGSRDDDAVRSLAEIARGIVEQSPYSLSRQLFTRYGGGLQVFADR